MPAWSEKLRSAPYGVIALLAVAIGLYVAVLANSVPASGGGEERISQAYAAFFLTLWLWIVLALLLLVGGIMGQMPRWAAISAIFLHPLAGLVAFVALDAVSRHVARRDPVRRAVADPDRRLRPLGAPAAAPRGLSPAPSQHRDVERGAAVVDLGAGFGGVRVKFGAARSPSPAPDECFAFAVGRGVGVGHEAAGAGEGRSAARPRLRCHPRASGDPVSWPPAHSIGTGFPLARK